MRIISKYKDYYDSLQDYDSKIWIRETNIVSLNNKTLYDKLELSNHVKSEKINNNSYKHTLPIIFGYCGNYYKYYLNIIINIDIRTSQINLLDDNNYSMEKVEKENHKSNWWMGSSFYDKDISFLNNENLFTLYNTPIFFIYVLDYYKSKGLTILINPSFKKYGFHKLKNVSQTYQDIEMYVEGVLSNNNEYPVLQDKHRQGSRFDKYSFRKLPEKSL